MANAVREACPDSDAFASFLAGELVPAEVRAFEQHLAACAPCRELLSALAPSGAASVSTPLGVDSCAVTHPLVRAPVDPDAALATGACVGRYVVLGPLGAGGMGVVYAAHDPELDRKVALKLLRSDRASSEPEARRGARLRREARAMAQLAHPHVVTVYDVGEFRGRIFVAMELVDGETLTSWLMAKRSRTELLAAFVAAAEGLAAAHDAGLVHRDFKPENVFVGRDGRVRVGDFGLARAPRSHVGAADVGAPRSSDAGELASVTHGLAGTPYYMPPEQLRGDVVDARSDQFSFCVALYLALSGQHPFEGEDAIARADAVLHGRLRPVLAPDPIPRGLRRLLMRGLSTDPEARFPSMRALIEALPRERARRWATLAVAVVAAVASVALVARDPQAAASPCRGAQRHWDGVWDMSRADAVEKAFAASGAPYAQSAAKRVRASLDAYRERWLSMHVDACEATRVRGEQSDELLDKRMTCLDARRRDARALIDRFVGADLPVVERAARALTELGELDGCADLAALSSQVPLPRSAATQAEVDRARSVLAELHASRIAGRVGQPQHVRARALLAEARATHYRPLEAEVLHEQGWMLDATGDYAGAKQAFADAVWAAEAGRHDALSARAWTRLMYVEGQRFARRDEALTLAPRVTALIERLAGDDDLEGSLNLVRARILSELDRYRESTEYAEAARASFERRYGPDDLRVSDALTELGAIDVRSRSERARATFERVLAIRERVYGPEHPEVGRTLGNLAHVAFLSLREPEALALAERALAIFERSLPAQHADIANAAHMLGGHYRRAGRMDEALASHRRAIDIATAANGRDHPNVASMLSEYGETLRRVQRYDEARAALGEACAIQERRLGPEHTKVGLCLGHMSRLRLAMGDYGAARADAARSLRITERVRGASAQELRSPLFTLGRAELALGRRGRAIARFERALSLQDHLAADTRGEIEIALAEALVLRRADRARAVALARDAQAHAESSEAPASLRAQIARFLATHSPPRKKVGAT